jgi:hypothetical protein
MSAEKSYNPVKRLTKRQEALREELEMKKLMVKETLGLSVTRTEKRSLMRPITNDISDLEQRLEAIRGEIKAENSKLTSQFIEEIKNQGRQERQEATKVSKTNNEATEKLATKFCKSLEYVTDTYSKNSKSQAEANADINNRLLEELKATREGMQELVRIQNEREERDNVIFFNFFFKIIFFKSRSAIEDDSWEYGSRRSFSPDNQILRIEAEKISLSKKRVPGIFFPLTFPYINIYLPL